MGFSEIIWNVHLQIHPDKILFILQKSHHGKGANLMWLWSWSLSDDSRLKKHFKDILLAINKQGDAYRKKKKKIGTMKFKENTSSTKLIETHPFEKNIYIDAYGNKTPIVQ